MTNPTLMPGQVVFPGPVGFAHNRSLILSSTYASATNMASWPSGAQPTKLSIRSALESGDDYTYLNVTTNESVAAQVSGLGILKSIIINEAGTATTLAVYDSLTAAGALIGTWATAAQLVFPVNAVFQTGLSFVTAGTTAANITLVYKKIQFLGLAVLNAPNDATAAAWLSQGPSGTVDVQFWPIFRDMPSEVGEDYPIARCDMSSTLNNLPVFIGGN